MSDKSDKKRKHRGGRPVKGIERATYRITIRMEPWMYDKLMEICYRYDLRPTDIIRDAIWKAIIKYRPD